MKTLSILSTTLALVLIGCAQSDKSAEGTGDSCMPCEELSGLRLPDIEITQTERVQDPELHCKVYGVIGKEIKFELLLPDQWNQRYLMHGNGGFAGYMQYDPNLMKGGYALSGTDTGHEGHVLKADWALNNMERQVNFGHLAVHRTASTSKAIIAQYYCSEPSFNYFIGCSRGGGQAMMEAQRYPEDFDGIVCAAPAFDWPAIAAEFVTNSRAVYPDPTSNEPVVSLAQIALLEQEVVAQCDELDGVADGILNDPRDCQFDFSRLPLCPGDSPADDCFTSAQLEAIKTIYQGVALEGNSIYPGFPFGAENHASGWGPWIVGPSDWSMEVGFPTAQYGFGTEMFKYLIYNDPDFDYSSYDFSTFVEDTEYAASYLNATSTDYSSFKDRGGKMIMWHGWNDPALSAMATIEHFEAAQNGDPNLQDYIRLYLLPGVMHCWSGPGPEEVNWLQLVRDWVEEGKPPERVVASKTQDGEVVMSRPVYPYPRVAEYDGQGDPNQESSFE